jgi:hypothetical protein
LYTVTSIIYQLYQGNKLGVLLPQGKKFSLLQIIPTTFGVHTALKLRICGALPLLFHMPPWHCELLNTETTLPFLLHAVCANLYHLAECNLDFKWQTLGLQDYFYQQFVV